MLYLRKQCDNTFAFRVNVAKIKEDGNFFPNNNFSNKKKQHICYQIKRQEINCRREKP